MTFLLTKVIISQLGEIQTLDLLFRRWTESHRAAERSEERILERDGGEKMSHNVKKVQNFYQNGFCRKDRREARQRLSRKTISKSLSFNLKKNFSSFFFTES